MRNPSKSRRKKELEKINLDEWANSGALDGMLSFLNIKPEEAAVNQGPNKVLSLLNRRITGPPPVIQDKPITDPPPVIEGSKANHVSLIDSLTPITGPPPVIGQDSVSGESASERITGPPPVIQTLTHPKLAAGFGNKKLHRCLVAQDGHSHSEEALYQLLWRTGVPETAETRLAVIGLGDLKNQLRFTLNNTRNTCHRLMAKLSIEEAEGEVSHKCTGKTYRVYSYKAILERRRAAGLEWVIRNRGVEFVTPMMRPESVEKETSYSASKNPSRSGQNDCITGPPPFIRSCITDPLPITGPGGGPVIGSPPPPFIRPLSSRVNFREEDREYKASTSTVCTGVVELLRRFGHEPDDDILTRLIGGCFDAAQSNTGTPPTLDEILYFAEQKLRLIGHTPNVRSPLALLAAVVPKCFEGESFRQFRQERAQRQAGEQERREAEQREIEAALEYNRRILADPDAPEDEKRLARMCLGLD